MLSLSHRFNIEVHEISGNKSKINIGCKTIYPLAPMDRSQSYEFVNELKKSLSAGVETKYA